MSDESADAGGKIVAIKEETVEFTAGIIGGAAGFILGGPVLGAIGAAAANYISKGEDEAGEIVGAVSKSALEVYNYLATLDNKYEVLGSAQSSLEGALDKLKSQEKVDPAAIEKVEAALASTKAKIEEVNDEYDLVGSGITALGVVGDLVEKTVKKVGELNEEYQLTDKAKTALAGAVDKAKDAASKA
jgi:phage-related tail protein